VLALETVFNPDQYVLDDGYAEKSAKKRCAPASVTMTLGL